MIDKYKSYLCRDRMIRMLRVRARPSWRCVQPTTHRGANEESPGNYAGDTDVTHRFDIVLRQTQPVYESSDAQKNHTVSVRALRSPRFLQRHSCKTWKLLYTEKIPLHTTFRRNFSQKRIDVIKRAKHVLRLKKHEKKMFMQYQKNLD